MLKAEACLHLLLEFDAAGDRSFDEDPDQAVVARPRDEAMRLGALDAEQLGNFALRLAAGEMQPGGACRERGFLVQLQVRRVQVQRFPISS